MDRFLESPMRPFQIPMIFGSAFIVASFTPKKLGSSFHCNNYSFANVLMYAFLIVTAEAST